MFYSQTFLARKGPLGTVWCAAHLQHKLRKSHYTATDIPDIVERIMFPEVPIALRMSSHLLLGVVRIYSKKVDYLYQDCNLVLVTLKNAFVYTDVNLPPNATQAQFNAVTLPDTYQLDALDIDDVWSSDAYQDNHVHRQEDITLADEIDNAPLGGYVAITFDDDIMEDSSHPEPPHDGLAAMEDGNEVPENGGGGNEEPPHDGLAAMDEDNGVPSNGGEGDQEPVPSSSSPSPPVADDGAAVPNTNDMNEPDNTPNVGAASHDIEDIEVMRDAVSDLNPLPVPELLDYQNSGVASPVQHSESIIRDKETPILSEDNARVQDQSPMTNPFASASGATAEPFQLNPSPNNNSVALELQPTPQAPKPKGRKRKQLFDKETVLSNEFMKNRLADCSDLVKKRKKVPCSSLDTWRVNNMKMKEQIFFEPSISGLCSDLRNVSEKGFILSNPNMVSSEETHQVPSTTQPDLAEEPYQETRSPQPSSPVEHLRDEPHQETRSPQPSSPVEHLRDEPHQQTSSPQQHSSPVDPVEHLRDAPHHHEPSMLADLIPSSPRIASPPSHHNVNSPLFGGTAFQSMQAYENTIGTSGSKQAAPVMDLEVGDYSGDAGRSYSPAFMNSADDELAFLEIDSHSPTDSQETRENDTLSARTRAVAQYLAGQSPSSPSLPDQHWDRTLSLKSMLHGRSRKICARMIYETLVLTSYGLINVEQEEPKEEDEVYGDIKLSLTKKVSKGQF